jgi:hypothetical protein
MTIEGITAIEEIADFVYPEYHKKKLTHQRHFGWSCIYLLQLQQ